MAEGGSDEETQPYPSLELARRGRPALLPGLVCGGAEHAQGLEGSCDRTHHDASADGCTGATQSCQGRRELSARTRGVVPPRSEITRRLGGRWYAPEGD